MLGRKPGQLVRIGLIAVLTGIIIFSTLGSANLLNFTDTHSCTPAECVLITFENVNYELRGNAHDQYRAVFGQGSDLEVMKSEVKFLPDRIHYLVHVDGPSSQVDKLVNTYEIRAAYVKKDLDGKAESFFGYISKTELSRFLGEYDISRLTHESLTVTPTLQFTTEDGLTVHREPFLSSDQRAAVEEAHSQFWTKEISEIINQESGVRNIGSSSDSINGILPNAAADPANDYGNLGEDQLVFVLPICGSPPCSFQNIKTVVGVNIFMTVGSGREKLTATWSGDSPWNAADIQVKKTSGPSAFTTGNINAFPIIEVSYPSPGDWYILARVYKKSLFETDNQVVIRSITMQAYPTIDANIKGWWKLEESGSTVSDSSGNGNTGTVTGAAFSTGCKILNCRQFSANDFVNVADSSTLEGMSSLTVSFWTKRQLPTSTLQVIVVKGKLAGDGTSSYGIWFDANNKVSWAVDTSTSIATAISSSTITDTTAWHHIAGTYGSGSLKLYIDGSLATSVSLSGTVLNTADPLTFGKRSGATPNYYNGYLDDIRVYNRVLSATEIQSLASQ